jgi:hypothetical protein
MSPEHPPGKVGGRWTSLVLVVEWASDLCLLPLTFRRGGSSLAELFEPYRSRLDDRDGFLRAVEGALRDQPELVQVWRTYSGDKRTSPSPYFGRGGWRDAPDLEVGFYESGSHDVKQHTDELQACADFIHREAVWVLEQRRAV